MDKWFAKAEAVITTVIRSLPEELREEAHTVGYVLHDEPFTDLDPDTLGFYPTMEEGRVSEQPGPVFLFIRPLVGYCHSEDLDFDEEVARTYLHELGHHLGFDEEDLELRDLG